MRSLLLVLALLPSIASAEENCGAMVRTSTRFRGTVRSIARSVVTIDVASVEDHDSPLRPGERQQIALEDKPALAIGRTLDLQAEWMTCDGKFRRFLALWQPRAKPETLAKDFAMLEVGHVYRAAVHTDADGDLALDQSLWIPHHHDQGITWTNLDAFPDRRRIREVVFEATAVEITQLEEWHWLSMWKLTIRNVR